MPTYEYECKTCGHQFEAFQSMSDAPLSSCEKCGKDVRRMINGGMGVIFKGSGFYVTDKGGSKGASSPSSTKSSTPAACASCPSCPSNESSSKEKAVG
jgi:putative FmdB family regulatory protein